MDTNRTWLPEQNDGLILKGIAFLISPVLGMLSAIVRPNTKSSYLILFLSFITIGLAMNIPDGIVDDQYYDSIFYRAQFEDLAVQSSSDFSSFLSDYSQMNDSGSTDIYSHTIFYFVSRFTDNYHVCFMVLMVIFAWFMLKAMRYLVSEPNYCISVTCLLLLFLFTICQIQKINAFRFYTAYWMAIYALLKIIVDGDKRYWLLLAATPAVHASFMLVFGIYALYVVMRGRHRLTVIVLVLAVLFSSIAVKTFLWVTSHLPGSLGAHYGSYLSEWYMQEINESGTGYKWIVRLFEALVRLSVNVIALFFATQYRTRIADSKCKNLYFFMMAVLAFADFTFMIPSVGSRFVLLAFPMIAYIWLVCLGQEKRYNWILYGFTGLYLFYFFALPWSIYQIPSFNLYTSLWNMDILYQSPLWLWYKLIFAH